MTRTTTPHSIVVKMANRADGVVRMEGIADEAITPGHLIRYDADEELELHADADGVLPIKLVALETLTPDTDQYPTTAKIDIPYTANDTIYFANALPGDVYYMWLAAGETAVRGQSNMVSNGDGTLKVAAVGVGTLTNSIFGIAEEDVDNAGGGAAVRLRVRAI